MKRVGGLYERIISVENLRLADEMARKGKKSAYGVRLHDKSRENNIIKLHETLKNGTYRTSPYTTFKIFDPKEREISRLPYYPDRILHWAVMLQLECLWVSISTKDTYSCIKGRGIHGAARKLHNCLRENKNGTKYCLKIDVKKFYPSIDHKILKSIIRRKIKDANLLLLLDEIIDSAPGVPIGNYLSQFFANLYLAYFDHWIKEDKKIKYYLRYCDDMVFLSGEKESLNLLLNEIKHYLKVNLNLELKGNYQVFPVDARGVDFVGYKFYHSHTLLRKGIKKNMMRKAFTLYKNEINEKKWNIGMASYWGWIDQEFVSSYNLKKKSAA